MRELAHTLFTDERVISIIGVIGVPCRGTAPVTEGTKIEL